MESDLLYNVIGLREMIVSGRIICLAKKMIDSNLIVKNESIIVGVFLTKIYLLSERSFEVTEIAFLSVTKPYVAVYI